MAEPVKSGSIKSGSIKSGAVTVAYCHSDDVAHSWHASLLDLIGWDIANSGRVMAGGWLAMKCGTGGLVEGRNEAVARFLAERDAEWLWWVDTDMGFAPDTVDRLVAAAHPTERPIVGGLCFANKEIGADGLNGFHTAPRPTIFDWVSTDSKSGFMGRTTYPVNALTQCAGTGSACLLIHRSALESIGEQFGTWYDRLPNHTNGGMYGEDLSLCIRAGAIGARIFVHTGVRTSHLKPAWVQESDYWSGVTVPPATEPVDIIVPVLDRPQNAAPFMRSLRASTGLYRVHVLVSRGDDATAEAWEACQDNDWLRPSAGPSDEIDIDCAGDTFASKVNVGAKIGTFPWVFITGDDVRFHPGWLDHAQAAAGSQFHVIGTNDLGNPKVMAGEHATHLLIRRSYIDQTGASWDGPGLIAHEGYRHQFVDNEIVTAAQQRGVWAMALGSRVEHLHPRWGKAEQDDTYRLGNAHGEADKALFIQRLERYR